MKKGEKKAKEKIVGKVKKDLEKLIDNTCRKIKKERNPEWQKDDFCNLMNLLELQCKEYSLGDKEFPIPIEYLTRMRKKLGEENYNSFMNYYTMIKRST